MPDTMLERDAEDTLFEQSGNLMAEPARRAGRQSAADFAAERAAFAAEAAALAAQRAAGLMERVGMWMGWTSNRAAQQEPMAGRSGFMGSRETMAESPSPEAGGFASRLRQRAMQGREGPSREGPSPEAGGIAGRLKQRAINVGERINDLSEGRYGLKQQKLEKPAGRGAKPQGKQRRRAAEKAAQEAAKQTNISWLPWTIGMSIGLVAGLVGVVYWQRHRLQKLWGETSQRVQQTTDTMRRRIETSRAPTRQQTFPRDVPTTPTTFTSLGSTPTARDRDLDRPIDSRQEYTNH